MGRERVPLDEAEKVNLCEKLSLRGPAKTKPKRKTFLMKFQNTSDKDFQKTSFKTSK